MIMRINSSFFLIWTGFKHENPSRDGYGDSMRRFQLGQFQRKDNGRINQEAEHYRIMLNGLSGITTYVLEARVTRI